MSLLRGWMPLLILAASLAYLLIDGHYESWLNGLPWRPLSLAAAVVGGVLAWALWPRGPDPLHFAAPDVGDKPSRQPSPRGSGSRLPLPLGEGWREGRSHSLGGESIGWRSGGLPLALLAALVLLTVGKATVGGQALMPGLPGVYFDNSRFQGDPERSSDFLREPWTRREFEINYGGDEFPVYFQNDVQRYNFFGAEAERRKSIPFSARWDGYLYVPADGSYQLWLTASGPAALRVDGRQLVDVDADGRETKAVTLQLTAGSHPIRLTYSRRPPRSPDLKLEWSLDGVRQAIRVPYYYPTEVTPEQWQRDRTILTISRGLDAAFLMLAGAALLGILAPTVLRAVRTPADRWPLLERAILAIWLLAAFWSATVPRLDRVDKLALLGGGQDWLTHESLARDILINGPLMMLGKPLGEGSTFYAQPFYPYALAMLHALTGEDQFGTLALQVFGSAAAGVLLYFLAKRLFGQWAAIATFLLFLPFWRWHLEWVAYRLISEAIYFVILPALFLALVRVMDERRLQDVLLAGLLLGLAVVTRGPTLLYVPFVGVLVWLGLRRAGLTRAAVTQRLALLFFATALIVGLVPLRNQLAAGQPSLLASSGGVNLQKLHRPSNGVRLGFAQDRWYAPYIQDAPTRETLEFIIQDPAGYIWACLLLAAYTLGYGAAIEESLITVWPDLIFFNLLYLAAIGTLAPARSPRAGLLHAFVLIHFATMVIFVPYDYDNRLALPMYLPIIVFSGYLLAQVAGRLLARARCGSGQPVSASQSLALAAEGGPPGASGASGTVPAAREDRLP